MNIRSKLHTTLLKLFVLLFVFIASSDAICRRESESQKLIDASTRRVLSPRPNPDNIPFKTVDDVRLRLAAHNGSRPVQDELIRRWSEGLLEIDPSRDLRRFSIESTPYDKLLWQPGYLYFFITYYAGSYSKAGKELFNLLQSEHEKEKQNPDASYHLGLMYYLGKGTYKDLGRAKVHLEIASKSGHPKAKIILGEMVFDRNDLSKAEPHYKAAADLGDLSGKYRLAQIYKHLRKNEEAHQLYYDAALGGYARAALDISHLYLEGSGCPQNIDEGLRWLKIAAGKGLSRAMYNLAVIYYQGKRVEQNLHEALEWTLKSVEFGCKDGRDLLSLLLPRKLRQERLRSTNPQSSMDLLIKVEALTISAPTPYLKSYFQMTYEYISLLNALKPGFMVTNIQPSADLMRGSAPQDQALTWQNIDGKTYYTVGRQNCALQKVVLAYHTALLSEKDNFEKHIKDMKERTSEFQEAHHRLTQLMDVYNPLTGVLIRNLEHASFAIGSAH